MADGILEPTHKGRSNAILTYKVVEEIKLGIQEVSLKLGGLADDIVGMDKQYLDHEHRLRVLEKEEAGRAGGSKALTFVYHAIWPMAAVIISALAYLK